MSRGYGNWYVFEEGPPETRKVLAGPFETREEARIWAGQTFRFKSRPYLILSDDSEWISNRPSQIRNR